MPRLVARERSYVCDYCHKPLNESPIMARLTLWDERDDPRGSILTPPPTDGTRLNEPRGNVTTCDVRAVRFPVPPQHQAWSLILHERCAGTLTRMDGWALEDWPGDVGLSSAAG